MSSQQKITFGEWYQALRNQMILALDGGKEIALKNFDQMAQKLNEQLQINEALKATKEPNLLDKKSLENDKKKK